jgi:hypothetical protein
MKIATLCGLLTSMMVFAAWIDAGAQTIPSLSNGVRVEAQVVQDIQTGFFVFDYRLSNPSTNNGEIIHFDVELTHPQDRVVLSSSGLLSNCRFSAHGSQDAFQRVPMVPVALGGPGDWMCGLGFTSVQPPYGFASWDSERDAVSVRPGQAQSGFRITSPGLPSIRKARAKPDIDTDALPDEYTENLSKTLELNEALTVRVATVGPQAPPQNFAALESLNYLITLVHDSRRLGWIVRDVIRDSLLTKLRNAKRRLEVNDLAGANTSIKAFLNEVLVEEGGDIAHVVRLARHPRVHV